MQVDGIPVDLDRREFAALVALLDSGRRVRSRVELASIVLRDGADPASYLSPAARQATEAVMGGLLAKLGEDPARPRWIEPVPGVGYRRSRA